GAKNTQIDITESEWEAIQARAVSTTKLNQILKHSNMDKVRDLASPKPRRLTSTKVSRANTLLSKGYTYAEVAEIMGVTSTVLREEIMKS
ncbi:hypothetical protein V6O07_08995, partial [Arthrospira platensis SPKY2]